MDTVVRTFSCAHCPLQGRPALRELDAEQIAYMEDFKSGEVALDRGDILLGQGEPAQRLYTVIEGVLMRFRNLEDGRRQIVNFMFPGDLVGLQGAFDDPVAHSVQALLPARLCVFDQARFQSLMAQHPRLGYDVIWLAAKEEMSLEEHIVALGRRTAKERVAYLAVWLMERARGVGLAGSDNRFDLPIRQVQIADMLGLSLVHTNRTVKALEREGIIRWLPGAIVIPDLPMACEFASYERSHDTARPFI